MAYSVRVTSLYVGQGTMNVVEVYNGDAPALPNAHIATGLLPLPNMTGINLVFLALVDAGSGGIERRTDMDAEFRYAIDYIRAMACRRAEVSRANPPITNVPMPLVPPFAIAPPPHFNDTGGYIDYVYLSHDDGDHKNLFYLIAQAIYINRGINAATHIARTHGLVIGTYVTTGGATTVANVQNFFAVHVANNNMVYVFRVSYINNQYKHLSGAAAPNRNPYAQPDIAGLQAMFPLAQQSVIAHTQTLNIVNTPLATTTTTLFIHPLIAAVPTSKNNKSILLLISIIQTTNPQPLPPLRAVVPIFSCLLTGDATSKTVHVFSTHFNPNPFESEFKYITIPHHGALSTMTNVNYTRLRDFLNTYTCHIALASGLQGANLYHPNRRIMYAFWDKVSTPHNPAPGITMPIVAGFAALNINPALAQSPPANPINIAAAAAHTNFTWSNNTAVDETCNNHLYSTRIHRGINPFTAREARNIHLTCSNFTGADAVTLDNKEFRPQ